MVMSMTVKVGDFSSMSSLDSLFVTGTPANASTALHVALRDCHSSDSRLFIVLFNLLTGRNYDFDFTHIM